MNKDDFELVKNTAAFVLRDLLQTHLEESTVSKLIYMLWTGYEAFDITGKKLKMYPIGFSLGFLIEIATGKIKPNKLPGENNPIAKLCFTGDGLKSLALRGEKDSIAWEAARDLSGRLLKENEILSTELRCLAADVLTTPRPTRKPGQNPMQKQHRDVCIITLIAEFERIGFTPVSKSWSSSTLSLCSALAEALNSIYLDRTYQYETIKAIWDKRKSIRAVFPDFRLDFREENGRKICYVAWTMLFRSPQTIIFNNATF